MTERGTKGRAAPQTQAEWFGELAHDAWERGQAALTAGDLASARRWFARASRIAPEDLTVALSLATALLRLGDPDAIALFDRVAQQTDAREALLGAAAARHAQGDRNGAAATLAELLSRHELPAAVGADALASLIADAIGAAGWCCLDDGGALRTSVRAGARLVIALDGRVLRGRGAVVPDAGARSLSVTVEGRHLLGSPLALERVRRIEGFVEARGGGLAGWAWMPGAPDTDAEIFVREVAGERSLRVLARGEIPQTARALARPRGFEASAESLAAFSGLLRVTGADGRDLIGSPLDPFAERAAAVAIVRAVAQRSDHGSGQAPPTPSRAAIPADIVGPPAQAMSAPGRAVAVVVPVHRGLSVTLDCLRGVEATMPAGTRLIVVDDATPEPALARELDAMRRQKRITLIRNDANRGFPASANAGLRAAAALAGGRDVVLLNSDALVTAGWLERLREAVHAAPDIGTATPFSNDATILSYPDRTKSNPVPAAAELRRIAARAAKANAGVTVDIPTAVGFCMYVRRECLDDVGLFREDLFAQGYGEENDFCIRARHFGWRHVAVPAVYVAHVGGQSFGSARQHLIARNLEILERLHPGYHALIAAFEAADPLAEARKRLDLAGFAVERSRRGCVVLVTHDSGGGVERVVRQRCEALRREGLRPIVLRPVIDRGAAVADREKSYVPGLCVVGDGAQGGFANLRFHLPEALEALAGILRRERPESVEFHHLLGHDPAVLDLPRRLGVPWDVHVHDYASFCPRITLVGASGRYCGEPTEVAVCEACIADAGRNIEEDISVAALRARSAKVLSGARRLSVPSADAATRLRRHFPESRPIVEPHEDDGAVVSRFVRPGRPLRVCIVGGIGVEKGFDVLLACARDAEARGLPIEFIVVGHTRDDRRLLATGRVFITGPYDDAEVEALIRAQDAHLAFLPSIWPETWCFTLGHAWRAGLAVAVFDIGAQAERIRRTGRGWVFPLGLPPHAVNNALLAVPPVAGDECAAFRAADPQRSLTTNV